MGAGHWRGKIGGSQQMKKHKWICLIIVVASIFALVIISLFSDKNGVMKNNLLEKGSVSEIQTIIDGKIPRGTSLSECVDKLIEIGFQVVGEKMILDRRTDRLVSYASYKSKSSSSPAKPVRSVQVMVIYQDSGFVDIVECSEVFTGL